VAKLVGCDPNSELTFQAAKKSGTASQVYSHVLDFCSGGDKKYAGGGYCGLDELAFVNKYTTKCAEEVFAYCVDIGYQLDVKHSNILASDEAPTDGTAVCMSVLGFSTVSDKIAIPMATTLWNTVTKAWLPLAMIIIFIIIMIAIGIARGKR